MSTLNPTVPLALTAGLTLAALAAAQGPPPPPPPRPIPGITAADPFPRGCVDCHVNRIDLGLDVRLSTSMRRWTVEVEPRLLEAARAAHPGGRLEGRHPAVPEALADIPSACLRCHGDGGDAVPFATLLHRIHLTGGEANHFLTLFQGECTHCHKLDAASGRWSLASGGEPDPPAQGAVTTSPANRESRVTHPAGSTGRSAAKRPAPLSSR